MKNINKLGLAGLCLGGVVGCAEMIYQDTPAGFIQETLPKWVQSSGYQDYKEQKKEEKERKKQQTHTQNYPQPTIIYSKPKREDYELFFCNHFNDDNNNKTWERNEFKGKKDIFKTHEDIQIEFITFQDAKRGITYIIKDSKRTIVEINSYDLEIGSNAVHLPLIFHKILKEKNKGIQEFNVEVQADGKTFTKKLYINTNRE